MTSSPTNGAATASPLASSGGTDASPHQFTPFDDKLQFLHEQSSCEQFQSTPNGIPAAVHPDDALVQNKNTEHEILTTKNTPHSLTSRSSPDAVSKPPLCFSSSLGSSTAFQSIDERYAQIKVNSAIMTPERTRMTSTNRMRELSAPLPTVPPSRPSSCIVHRSSLSQPHNLASLPAPVGVHLTPLSNAASIFSSPLVDHFSDQEGEISDSNSVEIISGYASDSIAIGRSCREGMSISQGFIESTRVSENRSRTPASLSSTRLLEANRLSLLPFSSSITESASTSSSHTPTPLHARNAISPSRTSADEKRHETASSRSPSASSRSFISSSKSPSPSRSQMHSNSLSDERRLSSESSPWILQVTREQSAKQEDSQDAIAQDAEDVVRTPNVYINGLPPHFPDESLYLMTREFGHVLSVRTFTRCVGEKMSGYGFVLFGNVESAERCIETLRKYRNLHPSFSKQVHKIPGTPYASGVITLPPAGSLPSLTSQSTLSSMSSFPSLASSLVTSSTNASLANGSSPKARGHRASDSISTISGSDLSGKDPRELSFREKMEKLKDSKSTNLYMEGLPLSIDDVTLAALVLPHKIVSSRFFQTKLSNPPRMISFVRLESRSAAEDVVERLHGRVVRGWNDNGCRISVRFADSNEQRELRRAERLARGEEEEIGTATRLSMAQAALINLRGAEAQAHLSAHPRQQHVASGASGSGRSFRTSVTGSEIGHVAHHTSQIFRSHPSDQLVHNGLALGLTAKSEGVLGLDSIAFANGGSAMAIPGPLVNAGISPLSIKSLDADRLALLQQQNQLEQLQLLQQVQNMTSQNMTSGKHWQALNQCYAINPSHLQSHSLMPSIDIVSEQTDEPCHEFATSRRSNPQISRQQGLTRGHTQSSQYMNKLNSAELSGTASLHEVNRSRLRHSINEDRILRNHQSSLDLHSSSRQTISLYPSGVFRSGGVHLSDELPNSSSRRHINIHEESEIPTVSPALTYTSRSPASLSPSTPLFNTFGTPASAPATVPLGKPTIRDRERAYRHELRQ